MNLRALQYALAVDRHGSFHRAADVSNISASALSRSIQALEDEFAVKLFDRSRGGVFPTAAGREFLRHARVLVSQSEDLATRMHSLGKAAAGEVVFGLGPLPAALYLSNFLAAMLRESPKLKVHVLFGSGAELSTKLDESEIEFLICADSAIIEPKKYEFEALCSFDLFVVTRKGHPLTRLSKLEVKDLEVFPMVGGGFHRKSLQLASPIPIDLHMACDNYEAIFSIIGNSDAWCLGPKLPRHLDNGLAYSPFDEAVFKQDASFILVQPRGRTLSLAAEIAVRQFRRCVQSA